MSRFLCVTLATVLGATACGESQHEGSKTVPVETSTTVALDAAPPPPTLEVRDLSIMTADVSDRQVSFDFPGDPPDRLLYMQVGRRSGSRYEVVGYFNQEFRTGAYLAWVPEMIFVDGIRSGPGPDTFLAEGLDIGDYVACVSLTPVDIDKQACAEFTIA